MKCKKCGLYPATVTVLDPEDHTKEPWCRACLIAKAREIVDQADLTLVQLTAQYGGPTTR